jgi:hypothetical protein
MPTLNFESNEEFYNFVKTLSANLRELGFAESAQDLKGVFETAWTTSSEMFGEIGLACGRILARDGKRLPPCLKEDLKKGRAACRSAFR